ncbi:putative NADH:ubiquinone oxidoreductase, chain G [Candidatus Zinderia insecticola CARI]|uniref:Putative NADH:ubiquinone oxidoreductase, chain G n=1 Tax=Zinderia insecticola (strain CARI) TaxID=871271 RepID=E0TIU3_ZINIC|nr:putative NADH:ubiquinone oxidoreductase, chain G [Candidatus Zinderia insecticola CARI]
MIKIIINNKIIKYKKKITILKLMFKLNKYIPHFCYYDKLSISTNCRMCLVEIKNNNKLLPACSTYIEENMNIKTNSKKVKKARKNIMEFLLINHPLDCHICDQGGECDLQDNSYKYGNFYSRFFEKKRIFFSKNLSKFISIRNINRCIYCTRCIRFSNEFYENKNIGIIHKNYNSKIFYKKIKNNFTISGNLIDLCPVGALTSRVFKYKTRPWQLKNFETISHNDSFGSILIVQKKNKILRILPKNKKIKLNKNLITDKDRFSYDYLYYKNRILNPKIKINNIWKNITWIKAFKILEKIFKINKNKNLISIFITQQSTIEEIYLLNKIKNILNIKDVEFRIKAKNFVINNKFIPWLNISYKKLKKINCFFLIGTCLSEHSLILNIIKENENIKKINILNNYYNNYLKFNNKIITNSFFWIIKLKEILLSILFYLKKKIPNYLNNIKTNNMSNKIAFDLLFEKKKIILLNYSIFQNKNFKQINKISKIISNLTNSKIGYLTESSNSTGCYILNFFSKKKNIKKLFNYKKNIYIFLNIEPIDFFNKNFVLKYLKKSKYVISLTSFKSSMKFSNFVLPITFYFENSGTFINNEGKIQKFKNCIKSFASSLKTWKFLLILINILKKNNNLKYRNIKSIFKSIKKKINFHKLLNKKYKINIKNIKKIKNNKNIKENKIEKIYNIPIFLENIILRNSNIILKIKKYFYKKIYVSKKLFKKFKIYNKKFIFIKKNKKIKIKIKNNISKNTIITNTNINISDLKFKKK